MSQFSRYVNDIKNLILKVLPFLKKKGMKISSFELRRILSNFNCDVVLPDEEYYLETEDKIREIIKKDKTDQLTYRPEAFDCDDFAYILKSTFVKEAYRDQKRLAPFAFGFVYGYYKGGGHAVNIYVNSDKQVKMIEPQSDRDIQLEKVFFIFM